METIDRKLSSIYKWDFPISDYIKYNIRDRESSFDLILPDQAIGIEFEVENWTKEASQRFTEKFSELNATVVDDGSLRNSGKEVVTRPMRAVDAMEFARDFFEVMPKSLDFSPRTSTHIHVNVRDYTTDQINSIIVTYLCVERLLYKFVGNRRSKGIFCIPLIDSTLPVLFGDYKDVKHFSHYWLKYSGLNLKPISSYGTIEFRHLGGTRSLERITDWLNLILGIIKFATTRSLQKVIERVYSLNSNSEYLLFLYELYGADLSNKLVFDVDYVTYMEEAVSFIKCQFYIDNPSFLNQLRSDATFKSKLFKLYTYPKESSVPKKKQAIKKILDPLPDPGADNPFNF